MGAERVITQQKDRLKEKRLLPVSHDWELSLSQISERLESTFSTFH